MKMKYVYALALASLLAGCFTVYESELARVEPTLLGKDRNLAVQLSGFESTVTTYVPIYGYETVLTPGCGRRRHHLYSTTYATETYVPQTSRSTVFLDRAAETFMRSGFTLQTTNPAYRVEVKFSGPFVDDADTMVGAAWTLLSVFSADYGVQTWTAKLNIIDLSTGKVALFHDYSERYQVAVWGPLPIFSPAGSGKTGFNAMQSRCLSVLTDRAVADATAFLAGKAK